MKDLNYLLSQRCDDCKHQMVLSVHTTCRSKEFMKELDEQNIKNVCMAFADEGIAEIGQFSSIGCECFEKQSDRLKHLKEDKRVRNDLDFL